MTKARDVDLTWLKELLAQLDELERAHLLQYIVDEFYDYAKILAVPGGQGLDGRDGPSERQSLIALRDEALEHYLRVHAGYR